MEITELQIGTKLELEPFDENGIRLDYSLVSEFEWLVDARTAMVAAPIHEGVIYQLNLGTALNVYFVKKSEYEYEMFSYKAVVKGREMNGNLALLKLEISSDIEKVQRRKYYRLGCSLPVKFRVADSMDELTGGNIPFRKTIATNLSGGGICLLLEDRLEVGKLVECEISPEEDKAIRFFGKVIRDEKRELETRFKYSAGIAYINIDNKDRETVVKYIFNQQRKLRKKGFI